MKKIIPLKKQLTFKTNVNEITSISLENTLHSNENDIEGELIINGTYKITDTSTKVDEFEFKIPTNIKIDEKYECTNITIDIEDFFYEIINNNILNVNIEVSIDNLIEKPIEQIEREESKMEAKEERCIEAEIDEEETKQEIKKETKIEENKEIKENKNTIFDNFLNETDEYSTYYIYIVREGDNVETIISKYNTTREKLEEYNNLDELKLGDKIIIPEKKDAGNKWNTKKIWTTPKKL